jgi:hypothetical protein
MSLFLPQQILPLLPQKLLGTPKAWLLWQR